MVSSYLQNITRIWDWRRFHTDN